MRGVRPMPLDLRPLTLAELLDRSFSLYKRHFRLFAGIMAGPAVFAMMLGVLGGVMQTPMAPGTPPQKALMLILPAVAGALFFLLLYMIVYMYALGATTLAVSDLYLERESSIGSAYRRVRGYVGRLVWLFICTFLAFMGATLLVVAVSVGAALFLGLLSRWLVLVVVPFGFLGAFIAFVLISVRFGVSVPALVIENVSAIDALKRSVELTSENVGRVFLIILCATVIAWATALIFQGPFTIAVLVVGPTSKMAMPFHIAAAISGAIGGMISGPIMIIGLAMMYYDLRIRKEALDLELMLANLDAQGVS
jgi:hypothetical protein